MAFSAIKGLHIRGIVNVLPKVIEDNLQLTQLPFNSREKLVDHTGIRFRHKVQYKETTIKSLFSCGVEELLGIMQWDKSSIDIILVVTQSAESSIPSLACELHGDLEFDSQIMAYDINLGCSGFVYGIHSAGQTLSCLGKKSSRAILCCGDISSQITEEGDLTVKPIFSDAVSVVGLEYNYNSSNATNFHFETFGDGKNAIYTEHTDEGNWMRLNGIDVFNYSVKYVPKNILKLYDHFNKEITKTDLFVLHQANKIINQAIVKSIGVPPSKTPSSLYEHGNTASASIPLTLALNNSSENKEIILSGFGVGFSVASCLIRIENTVLTKTILLDV